MTKGSIFGGTVSLLALAIATPAFAQDSSSAQDTENKADEIIVSGIRASLEASLDAKRTNDIVSEVITAQDIGKFPDKNVADSLGRLTGVNVVTGSAAAGGFGENQSVSIRGTDPTLNLTLLDGHSVATGDWFVLDQTSGGRSFDFSLLPSEVVGQLEVFKSSEADIVEGGIGGTINLKSRRPFDLKANSFSLTAQMNYNDLADKWKPQVSGLYSWKNDDETFGVLVSGFYQERAFRRDGEEFLGYANYADFDGTGQTVAAPTLIGQSYFRQKRVRKGGTLALQFKPTDTLEINANAVYTRMDADNINVNSMAWVSRLLANNSTPGTDGYALAGYTIKDGYLTQANWNATTANGAPVQGRVQDDIFRKSYSSTWVANLAANWQATDRLNVSGQVGYTEGKGVTTDSFAWETYWDTGMGYNFAGKGAVLGYPGLPTDPTSDAYLNNYYSWSWGAKIKSPDKEFYGNIDAEYDIGNSFIKSIKVGARLTNHKRAVNDYAYSWAGNGAYSGTKLVGLGTVYAGGSTPSDYLDGLIDLPGYTLADQDLVLDQLDGTNGGRVFDFYPQASFSVKEKTQGFYAMAKLGDDSNWRGNIGLRAVHTDLTTTQYSPNAPVADTVTAFCATCGKVQVDRSYWDFLPSANLTYNLRDDLLLRAGAAKVMSRPGYAQLAGAFTVSDLALTGTAGGNPYLKPYRAWNFNLAAEWYYAPQALLSVTLFYLDIDSYITNTTSTVHLVTQQHPDGADFLITQPINGAGGKNKGFEVSWQQPIWGGFGFQANYTYANAKDDDGNVIDGNSKHTYNLTGYFENKLVSARLAYTFRSKFQSGIDRATPMWQDNFGSLDGSVTVNVTDYAAITVDAQNLLNHKLYYFVGDPAIPRAYYNNGRTFWVGAKIHF